MPKTAINYIEFGCKDIPSIKAFYSKAFGWEFTDYGPDYAAVNDGTTDGGFYHAGADWAPAGNPLVVLYTTDLEGMLQQVEDAGERMVLDQQNVEQLFQDFKSYVRNELNQVPVAEQLAMMAIEHVSENEIRVLCVSTVNHIYGNNQREVFLDYAKKKTFIPDLRVMVQLDPTARKEIVIERPMNKMEIFEEMAGKNPALRQLRESLNLQVE